MLPTTRRIRSTEETGWQALPLEIRQKVFYSVLEISLAERDACQDLAKTVPTLNVVFAKQLRAAISTFLQTVEAKYQAVTGEFLVSKSWLQTGASAPNMLICHHVLKTDSLLTCGCRTDAEHQGNFIANASIVKQIGQRIGRNNASYCAKGGGRKRS